MKKITTIVAAVVAVAMAALFLINTQHASAHEHREVGEYEIGFGWQVEPAYVGVFNGPELTIAHHDTGEPVEGAEETLELTVSFGSQTKTLALEPAFNEPGRYVAYVTPTRPGDYSFELTGTISTTDALTETVVSEIFTSADGEFSSIEPIGDVLFPDDELDMVGMQSQIDALREEIEALQEQIGELTAE
jgi:hypothetical protein